MKMKLQPKVLPIAAMSAIFLSAVLLRIYWCSVTKGYEEDHGYFIIWMKTLQTYGLGHSYAVDETLNYPPVFLIILRAFSYLIQWLQLQPEKGDMLIRLPSLMLDVFAMGVFLVLSRGAANRRRMAAFAFFALNPVFMYSGPVWGQVDMLHSTLMVLAVYWIIGKPFWSGGVYAVALLAKFQSIMIAPVLGMYLLHRLIRGGNPASLGRFLLGMAAPFSAAAGYFLYHGTLVQMVEKAYTRAVDLYPFVTLNAVNIWYYVVGIHPWTPDHTEVAGFLTFKTLGFLLVLVALGWVCFWVMAKETLSTAHLLIFGAASVLCFYMLSTQMHERYIIPAIVMLCFAVYLERRMYIPALVLSITTLFNLVLVVQQQMSLATALWLACLNTGLFIWLLASLKAMGAPSANPPARRTGQVQANI